MKLRDARSMFVNFFTNTGSFLRKDNTLVGMMLIGFCVAVVILPSNNSGVVGTVPTRVVVHRSASTIPCQYQRLQAYFVRWMKRNCKNRKPDEELRLVTLNTFFNAGKKTGPVYIDGPSTSPMSFLSSSSLSKKRVRAAITGKSPVVELGSVTQTWQKSLLSFITPAGPVGTKPYASLLNGSTAILPCHYASGTYGVYWTKANGHTEPAGNTIVQLDTYFNVGERSGPGLKEGRFNISDDFSLVISPVLVTDQGPYSCMVSDITTGATYSNSTEVTVFVYARKPFVNIIPCEHSAIVNQFEDLGNTRCTYVLDNKTRFQFECSVSGVKPNVSLIWMTNGTNAGTNYALMSTFEDRGDGTFDQKLALMGRGNETMNGTVFTCVAEGLAVNGSATGSVIFVKTASENVEPDIPVDAYNRSPEERN